MKENSLLKKTGMTKTYYGDTISLGDIAEQDFEVTTRARYNTTIINGTSCTQVEKIVQGTMVTMYETNPNTASNAHTTDNNLIRHIVGIIMTIIIIITVILQCLQLFLPKAAQAHAESEESEDHVA